MKFFKSIFLIICLCCSLGFSQEAEVVINAEQQVNIGDLIVIDLSESKGEGFDYFVEPTPPGLRVFNDGKIIVCGTGDKSTTYTFSISCAVDNDSDIAVHKITVNTASPPDNSMVSKVKEWAGVVESPTKRDDALKLAQAFASVAIVIEQDTFKSPEELVKATATSNREALGDNLEYWTPLLENLMKELKEMDRLGKLSTIEAHIPVWKDIAQGLREYALEL